jgi:hypothetical protein
LAAGTTRFHGDLSGIKDLPASGFSQALGAPPCVLHFRQQNTYGESDKGGRRQQCAELASLNKKLTIAALKPCARW